MGADLKIDHTARARDAWPHLVRRARENRGRKNPNAFKYGEISKLIGVHHRAATHFLCIIQDYCRDNHLPKLQSLVVNAKEKSPGEGYDGDRSDEGVRVAQREACDYEHWPMEAPFWPPKGLP